MAMTEYQIDQKTHPGKTTVDDLVKNIKKIAFECTSRPECRCPKVISKHVTEPNVLNSLNQQLIVWKLKKHVMPISIQDWPLQRIKQDLIKLLESWKRLLEKTNSTGLD